MVGKRNSIQEVEWRKRWVEYCANLETIKCLEEALGIARASASEQLAEVRILIEDWVVGPAPSFPKKSPNSRRSF